MIGVWNGLRALAGDGLIAVGTAMRNVDDGFDERLAANYLLVKHSRLDTPDTDPRMECDGPDAAEPAPAEFATPDSELLRTAAHLIAGWKAILLRGAGSVYDADELDELVERLRDRAAQFEAIELDTAIRAANPIFPTTADHAADVFPQFRGE